MLKTKYLMFISFFLSSINTFADSKMSCDLFFKKIKTCAKIDWIIPPKKTQMVTEKDKSEFALTFFQKSNFEQQVVPKGELKVRLYMPSMGHGSYPTHTRSELDTGGKNTGKYFVEDVYFTMPGKWEIQVELINKEKVIDRAIFQYLL